MLHLPWGASCSRRVERCTRHVKSGGESPPFDKDSQQRSKIWEKSETGRALQVSEKCKSNLRHPEIIGLRLREKPKQEAYH